MGKTGRNLAKGRAGDDRPGPASTTGSVRKLHHRLSYRAGRRLSKT